LIYYKKHSKNRKVITMSVLNINQNNFNEIMSSDKPVLIDFWAPWCGPCRMQGPIVEQVSEEMGDDAVVAKLNVDENPEIASQFSVMSIPTLVIIKSGKVVEQKVGVTPKETLIKLLNAVCVAK
jgi:thioredoxin 1